MTSYTASLHYDRRLYRQDVAGSIAHARMLARQNIIDDEDARRIVEGLAAIQDEIEAGQFPWRDELEDIHMNVESRLHELIGPSAGKLHTGRSRNDQVAVDMRMYTREVLDETEAAIAKLQRALLTQAEAHCETVMPGYTHMQRAQPVLLAHHLMAYFQMLQRDRTRMKECRGRTNVLPLGSGALAGVPYPLDRYWVATELGFESVTANSMDAVSDRDYLLDFHAAAATCMMHLSRLSEELVLWSSSEFGYAAMAPEFSTGSSIMPQKRNPDFAEIARGKTGRVYGSLMALLTVMKGLPLTYNRDMQEDKEGFFDTADTLLATLGVMSSVVSTMELKAERMEQAASDSFMLATDMADYLVGKGLPFRQAHGAVRELCAYAQSNNQTLEQLPMKDYRRFSDLFEDDVYHITPRGSAEARNVVGGTAPAQVRAALDEAKRCLGEKQ